MQLPASLNGQNWLENVKKCFFCKMVRIDLKPHSLFTWVVQVLSKPNLEGHICVQVHFHILAAINIIYSKPLWHSCVLHTVINNTIEALVTSNISYLYPSNMSCYFTLSINTLIKICENKWICQKRCTLLY